MPQRVIAYARASTGKQVESGLGLEAQWAQLDQEARRRGWAVAARLEDPGVSGATNNRPGLKRALELLDADDADVLVVTKLDRVARSAAGFVLLMEQAKLQGWAIVILELGLDTTTPIGRAVAGILAQIGELEREFARERTRAAAQAKRARGQRSGRPPGLPLEVRQRIAREHAAGVKARELARRLTAEGIPTLRGGPWSESTIRSVVASVQLDQQLETIREGRTVSTSSQPPGGSQ